MRRIAIALIPIFLIGWMLGPSMRSHAAAPPNQQQTAMTVVAVGDSSCDPANPHYLNGDGDTQFCQQKATSELALAAHPAAVLALGDNQYEDATLGAFMASYDPSWGRLKAITYPVLGNHEYQTPGATGYFDYFGLRVGARDAGYYSVDIGSWHVIALNSECRFTNGCGPGSPQEQWLLSDLAAHRNLCTVAMWHSPRFTSGRNRNHPELSALWDDLYAYGVDLVLNGHDHIYERFAPQTPQKPDARGGIREFIVGTGGNNHQPNYGTIQPNSLLRDNTTYGVLELTLRADSYDWKFVPANHAGNGTVTDSGTDTCHGPNAGADDGSGPRAVPVVSSTGAASSTSRFVVDFDSSKSGGAFVLFGSGPGCSGLILTATMDAGAGTTHHRIVVTGDDFAWAGLDMGIIPGTTYWYELETQTSVGTEIDNNNGKCYSVTIPKV